MRPGARPWRQPAVPARRRRACVRRRRSGRARRRTAHGRAPRAGRRRVAPPPATAGSRGPRRPRRGRWRRRVRAPGARRSASSVPRATRLVTSTSCRCPIRCRRPSRCSICIGFHGRSKLTITWQNWRLRPSPAASVLSSTGASPAKAAIAASFCARARPPWYTAAGRPAAATSRSSSASVRLERGEDHDLLAALGVAAQDRQQRLSLARFPDRRRAGGEVAPAQLVEARGERRRAGAGESLGTPEGERARRAGACGPPRARARRRAGRAPPPRAPERSGIVSASRLRQHHRERAATVTDHDVTHGELQRRHVARRGRPRTRRGGRGTRRRCRASRAAPG